MPSYPWLNYLRDINLLSILLRLFLAMFVGAVLGIERGRKHRPAGLRTYMLVSMGAALVMMTNQYVYSLYGGDPVRLGAQVISGIGFLGAGSIIITGRNQVKGITTAAGLWAAACCGLCAGIGFYEGAILGTISVYIIIVAMQRVDDYFRKHSSVVELYLEYNPTLPFSEFLTGARDMQIEITEIQTDKSTARKRAPFTATLLARSLDKLSHEELKEALEALPGVLYLEEL